MLIGWIAAVAMATGVAETVAPPTAAVATAEVEGRSTWTDGVLTLNAGERVVLRLNEAGDFSLVSVGAPVDAAHADPGTVSFTLFEGGSAMLKVQNGLEKAFRYDAYFDRARRQRTSICTVLPNLMGFESWGQPVRQFTLTNLRVVGGGEITCE